jgi:hypothetical protein
VDEVLTIEPILSLHLANLLDANVKSGSQLPASGDLQGQPKTSDF